MFKLEPNPVFTAEVELNRLDGESGVLKLKFKYMGRKELFAYLERVQRLINEDADAAEPKKKGKEAKVETPADRDLRLLLEVVLGWEEVDVPFTKENFAKLLDSYHNSASAIFAKFSSAPFEAKEKNS